MGAGSVMRLEARVACSRWGPAPSCGLDAWGACSRWGPAPFFSRAPSWRAAVDDAAEKWVRAVGEEEDDGDEEHAVDDQVGAVQPALAEVCARDLAERREDERAEDRPQQRAGAADDRPDDDLDRQRDAEDRVGLQREEVERVE